MVETKAKEDDPKTASDKKPVKEASWVAKLRKFNESKPHKTAAENDREADVEFLKLLEEEKQMDEERNPSFKTIPKFFFKKPTNENSLYLRVR